MSHDSGWRENTGAGQPTNLGLCIRVLILPLSIVLFLALRSSELGESTLRERIPFRGFDPAGDNLLNRLVRHGACNAASKVSYAFEASTQWWRLRALSWSVTIVATLWQLELGLNVVQRAIR